jgi:serine/threonine protein kinase
VRSCRERTGSFARPAKGRCIKRCACHDSHLPAPRRHPAHCRRFPLAFPLTRRLLASLEHPNLTTFYDGFCDHGKLCIIQELVAGGDLASLLGRLLRLLRQLCASCAAWQRQSDDKRSQQHPNVAS